MSGEYTSAANARRIADRAVRDSPKPATPYTPTSRFISSTYSSPGSTYGKEEDAVILELNQRYVRAGIEGESCPQCCFQFSPNNARRVGDYRTWIPGYIRQQEALEEWGEGYELWKTDLRDFDLGLVSDRLERAVREIYNKNLLVDAASAKLILILPPVLAHPTLSAILQTLLERWNYSTVTLVPAPTMAIIGAGLRSGLVIDIGWEETTVSSIYEYREVGCVRSTRAMKMLTKAFAEFAQEQIKAEGDLSDFRFDLELVEEIICRLRPTLVSVENLDEHAGAETVSVEWPKQTFSKCLAFEKASLLALLSKTFVGDSNDSFHDDQEIPLGLLMFQLLLSLPPDIRSICMTRIMFIGSGADIPVVSKLCLRQFESHLLKKGWNGVTGSKLPPSQTRHGEISRTRPSPPDARFDQDLVSEKTLVEERFIREKTKSLHKEKQGIVRQVDTLGPWAGASLMATLKVKSFVEIQRDRFLSHGLSGASRDFEISVIPQQRTSNMAVRSKAASEKNGWTLAGWA